MTVSPPDITTSDYNLPRIDTSKLSQHLDYSIAAASNMVIIGRRGSGKSIIGKERIQQSGCREVYINLSVFERPDLAGIPRVFNQDPKARFIDYFLPRMYEPLMEGKKKVVIFFDEADKADDSIFHPLLEISQFHSLNGTSFPNLQSCIFTGNLISEGSKRIHPALMDRAEAYLLQPNAISWLEWAAKVGIHPAVYAFIRDNPHRLFGSDQLSDDMLVDPSPRSWEMASNIIKFGEEHNYEIELILEKVCGFVGRQVGAEFRNYYTHYKVLLPFVESVFNGEDVSREYKEMGPTDKLAACLVIAARLAAQLDAANPEKDKPPAIDMVANFLKYVSPEHTVICLRSRVQGERIRRWNLRKHPVWTKILDNITNVADGK